MTPEAVAALIDHTRLTPDTTRADIEQLCREAAQLRFAAVCVNPTWVGRARHALLGTGVRVCTVVGFPLGATLADVKAYETSRAILDGAAEIDMVINLGALKSGDLETVRHEIDGVLAVAHARGAIGKIIIETALLSDDEKIAACTLARDAGADFVKTSTGFASAGATVADVVLMRRVVGRTVGVKAAGGIRDLDALLAMTAAGATRIGSSAGVRLVQQARVRRGT